MIWDELTRMAFAIASRAHASQVDKGGVPYIFHPLAVAEQMPDSIRRASALLHDVCEDTDVTLGELRQNGIPEPVIEAVQLLTHSPDDGMTYLQYVEHLKGNEIAADVKRADLHHNLAPERQPKEPTDQDISQQRRYHKALAILGEQYPNNG